jgi:hypothetical protein
MRFPQRLNLLHHELRLFALAVAGHDAHRLTLARLCEEGLPLPGNVVADDPCGGAEDVAGGAVVLFELHDLRTRKVALEIEDVVDVGAAEAVDRLILIADRDDVSLLPHQQFHEHVLGAVRVLIFVDEEVAEAAVQLGPDIVVLLEQHHVVPDEIVEIHGVELFEPPLIEPIDLADTGPEKVGVVLLVLSRAAELVLGRGDPVQHGAGGKGVVVEVQLPHAAADQRQLVGRVVHGE